MKRILNEEKLNYYIDLYDIHSLFQKPMDKYMELHLFTKDEHIYRSNSKIEYFYFLVEGKTKVYTLLTNGKSLLLRFYNPFKIIGDVEFVDYNMAISNIQVIKEALCIGISLDNLRKHGMKDPVFLKYLCKSLGEKLATSSISNSINLLYPLENRLASYILAITPEGNASPLDGILTNNLTEIGELLGTSYRHLIRTINKLCKDKIIKKDNNLLVVLNREALKNLAGDLYE